MRMSNSWPKNCTRKVFWKLPACLSCCLLLYAVQTTRHACIESPPNAVIMRLKFQYHRQKRPWHGISGSENLCQRGQKHLELGASAEGCDEEIQSISYNFSCDEWWSNRPIPQWKYFLFAQHHSLPLRLLAGDMELLREVPIVLTSFFSTQLKCSKWLQSHSLWIHGTHSWCIQTGNTLIHKTKMRYCLPMLTQHLKIFQFC